LPADLEQRSKKSAQARHRMANAYRRVIRPVAERIARRESQDIFAQAKKSFGGRGYSDFSTWLSSFYGQHEDYVRKQMLPVISAYADLVADQADDEIGYQHSSEDLDRFVRAYVNEYARRHRAISEDRIRALLAKAQTDGKDALEMLQASLESWEDHDPETIANRESVRANNAVATTIYAMSGMVRVLKWVSFGESCPYCQSLDGTTVGIDEVFLSKGQNYQPDGADRPLRSGHDVRHAPAHDGCDCQVVAGG
jgi:hypothetical protein